MSFPAPLLPFLLRLHVTFITIVYFNHFAVDLWLTYGAAASA